MSIQRLSNAGQSGYRYKTLIAGITPVPSVPTIGVATALSSSTASVAFTAPGAYAGSTYTATSSPGGFTGTSATSPIVVSGLTESTSYTFTVTATNATGTSGPSSASSSITTAAAAVFQGVYDALASTTVSSGGSSAITFYGIPQNYAHLQVRGTVLGTAAASGSLQCKINGDGGTNYTRHELGGNGSSAYVYANTAQTSINMYGNYDNIANNNFPCTFVMDIVDYTDESKYKTIKVLSGMDKNGASYGETFLKSSLWQNKSAVTSLSIYIGGQNLAQYSSIALYGVK